MAWPKALTEFGDAAVLLPLAVIMLVCCCLLRGFDSDPQGLLLRVSADTRSTQSERPCEL
jgi:hypothetical protein